MKPEFYIVMDPWKTEYATGELPDNVVYDFDKMERCPLCGALVSGGYWPRPREVALTNRRVPDFLYSYSYEPFLISERALAVIRQAGLTGIQDVQEIEHVRFQRKGKKEVPIPKYYYLELVRSKMTINHEKSVIAYGKCREGDPYSRACPCAIRCREPMISCGIWNFIQSSMKATIFSSPMRWADWHSFPSGLWMSAGKTG